MTSSDASPDSPLTTPEALDKAQEELDLTEDQARLLAAKEGLVRAIEEDEPKRIVLKGGTLLHHGYGSPRVSIADVDYADPSKDGLNENDVKRMADIDRLESQGFRIAAQDGTWTRDRELVEGAGVPFVLSGMGSSESTLSISVSVRQKEVLDGIRPVEFRPVAIALPRSAQVSGQSLAEAGVEKVIGYCLKGKKKHFSDMAWIARDHPEVADRSDDVRAMLVDKVEAEMAAEATRDIYAGIAGVPALLDRLDRESRMNRLRKNWGPELGTLDLLFDQGERERDDSLRNIEWVIETVHAFWGEILGPLRS